MKCKRCGKEINKNAKFCENCGARIQETSSAGHSKSKKTEPKRNNTLMVVLLCILIGIMIFVAAAVGAYMFMDNGSSVLKESYDKRDKAAAEITAAPATAEPAANTEKPDNTPKPTAKPVSNETENHIAEPTYKIYSDTEMGFSCAYPTHFEKYNDNTDEGRYTLQTSDKSVSLRICAEKNDADITLAQSMSMFKTKNPGDIEYSKTGNTYYAIRINDNGICRYRYLVSKNEKLYWFDFNYPEEYRDIYEGYIDHIYRSFTVR